ncbi:MAG: hypothetical protein R6W76_12425 [Caldilinea sp.]
MFDFDIISPIDTLFGVAHHGKMHRFAFDVNSGFNGYRVEKLLRRYGVRVWGRKVSGSKRSFLVKRSQAVWAEYILCRAGVPLLNPLLDPRNAHYPDQHPDESMPEPWTEQGVRPISFVDHLGEWMAKLFG